MEKASEKRRKVSLRGDVEKECESFESAAPGGHAKGSGDFCRKNSHRREN